MTEDYDKMLHERAAGMVRANGIVSIVFGSLGVLVGLLYMLVFAFGGTSDSYESYDVVTGLIFALLVFIFAVLPHIFLIISGATLVRLPSGKVARGLTIANLVIGALWNLVILIMSIISLTQMNDYERGHHHKK
ncbi:MAG: hypothetical protein ABIP50_02965 [Candidatus Saccharimonadales bacterium]